MNTPWKWLPGVKVEGFPGLPSPPSTPAVVLDAQNRKLCECDSDELARMVCAIPEVFQVIVMYVANPHNPVLLDQARLAIAKFEGTGPFAPKLPGGTE
jgi:hypothetical protein